MQDYFNKLTANVPELITSRRMWTFAIQDKDGKPKRPVAKQKNSDNISPSWNGPAAEYFTLFELIQYYNDTPTIHKEVHGAGIVLDGDQPFTVLDGDRKDGYSESDKRLVDEIETQILTEHPTFMETSYGGGIHAFIATPAGEGLSGSKQPIELFSKNRFIAITGNVNEAYTCRDINSCDAITATVTAHVKPTTTSSNNTPATPHKGVTADDVALVVDLIDNQQDDNYAKWIKVILAISETLGKNEEGHAIALAWSESGANAGPNVVRDVAQKYYSHNPDAENPVGFGTLIDYAKQTNNYLSMQDKYKESKSEDLRRQIKLLYGRDPQTVSDSPASIVYATLPQLPPDLFPDRPKGRRKVEPTMSNVEYMLQEANIQARYNNMTKEIEIDFNVSPIVSRKFKRMNVNYEMLDQYAHRCNMRFANAMFTGCVDIIANNNLFHPVLDMIGDGKGWDKQDRIQELIDCVEPIDDDIQKEMWPVYMRNFLNIIYDRMYSHEEPNIHAGTLILKGKQGAGKSSFFRELVNFGPDFPYRTYIAVANPSIINEKDSMEQVGQYLLGELEEIDTLMSRVDSAELKKFITRDIDVFRKSYAPRPDKYPRTVALCGTTNATTFLNDATGSRRFQITEIDSIDLPRMKAIDKVQLFKQVAVEYHQAIADGVEKPYELAEEYWESSARVNRRYNRHSAVVEAWHQFANEHNWHPMSVKLATQRKSIKAMNISGIHKMMGEAFNKRSYSNDLIDVITETLGESKRKRQGLRDAWPIPWNHDNNTPAKIIPSDVQNVLDDKQDDDEDDDDGNIITFGDNNETDNI